MQKTKLLKAFLTFSFLSLPVNAIEKGSLTTPSIQPFFTFPAGDANNKMLAFGYFKNGFGLQNAETSCTFSSIFPVSGQINLNGGQLLLDTDLILQNPTTIQTSGYLNGNFHLLDLSESIETLPASTLNNINLYINSDVIINETIRIKGNCTIDGNFNSLTLSPNGQILIANNSSLQLKNLTINKAHGTQICCHNHSGSIILHKINWYPDNDIKFSKGSILFDEEVKFFGPHSLIYSSPLTSTINSNTSVMLSRMDELLIGRKYGNMQREPLHFVDQTSTLFLDTTDLHITESGAVFTNGTLLASGEVVINIEAKNFDNALIFGNGSAQHDFNFFETPGSHIDFKKGAFVYDNATNSSFSSDDLLKQIKLGSDLKLFIKQNVNFINVNLTQESGLTSILLPNLDFRYNNVLVDDGLGLYKVTATISESGFILAQNDTLTLQSGFLIIPLLVAGNALLSVVGIGNVTAPISLLNDEVNFSLNVVGRILNDISLGGGTISLLRDLVLGPNVLLTEQGTVNLADNNCSIKPLDNVWTSTITWDGQGGLITLSSDLILASTMTFSGNCTIEGNGNIITLVGPGNIKVAPGSFLTFKNVSINNVHSTNISCNDYAARIKFDHTILNLTGDYTLEKGAFIIHDPVNIHSEEGSYAFILQSTEPSIVHANSMLTLHPNTTLKYDPTVAHNDLLTFENSTSELIFIHATLHSTVPELNLTKGTIIINGSDSEFSTEGSIILGDSVSSSNDITMIIQSGSKLSLTQGSLVYQDVNQSSWQMGDTLSTLQINANNSLILNQTLNLGSGQLLISSEATLTQNNDAQVIGSVNFF